MVALQPTPNPILSITPQTHTLAPSYLEAVFPLSQTSNKDHHHHHYHYHHHLHLNHHGYHCPTHQIYLAATLSAVYTAATTLTNASAHHGPNL